MKLIICQHCHRHVLAHEVKCPFCQAVPLPSARSSALGAAAIAVGLSMALQGCSGTVTTPDGAVTEDGSVDSTSTSPVYGVPAVDSGVQPMPDSAVAMLYMAVRPDSGDPNLAADATDAQADQGVAAVYGIAPPPDGGNQ